MFRADIQGDPMSRIVVHRSLACRSALLLLRMFRVDGRCHMYVTLKVVLLLLDPSRIVPLSPGIRNLLRILRGMSCPHGRSSSRLRSHVHLPLRVRRRIVLLQLVILPSTQCIHELLRRLRGFHVRRTMGPSGNLTPLVNRLFVFSSK